MPFKLNQKHRRHFPRQKHRVINSAAYDATLRQRGSLTVWVTDKAIADWRAEPRTTPGGQPCYSPLAILTGLTLRTVFRLALRQTEGLIGSIIGLLGLELRVPDAAPVVEQRHQPSPSAAARFTPSSFSSAPGNSRPATPIRRYSANASGQSPNSAQMLREPGPQEVHQKRTGIRRRGAAAGASTKRRVAHR